MTQHGPNRPTVKLVGTDGNVFAIIGACKSAARKNNWLTADIDALMKDMMSGDYNHVLAVAMENFDVQ